MAAKDFTINLTDQEQADCALFLKGRTIPEMIYQDYIVGNITRAAPTARLNKLPAPSRSLIAALEAQQAADKADLIKTEYAKLP